jgi:uncharacterized protein YukE
MSLEALRRRAQRVLAGNLPDAADELLSKMDAMLEELRKINEKLEQIAEALREGEDAVE